MKAWLGKGSVSSFSKETHTGGRSSSVYFGQLIKRGSTVAPVHSWQTEAPSSLAAHNLVLLKVGLLPAHRTKVTALWSYLAVWEGNWEGRDIIFRIFILPSKAEISPLLRSALSSLYKREKIFLSLHFFSPVAILMHEYTWPDGGCLNYGPLTDDGHVINKGIDSDFVQFILRPDIREWVNQW